MYYHDTHFCFVCKNLDIKEPTPCVHDNFTHSCRQEVLNREERIRGWPSLSAAQSQPDGLKTANAKVAWSGCVVCAGVLANTAAGCLPHQSGHALFSPIIHSILNKKTFISNLTFMISCHVFHYCTSSHHRVSRKWTNTTDHGTSSQNKCRYAVHSI